MKVCMAHATHALISRIQLLRMVLRDSHRGCLRLADGWHSEPFLSEIA